MKKQNMSLKIIIISIIFILFINVINSYAADWRAYKLEQYKNSTPEDEIHGELYEALKAAVPETMSKEELEKYIEFVDAFVKSKAGTGAYDGTQISFINENKEKAIKKLNGQEDEKNEQSNDQEDGKNGQSNENIYNKSWANYITNQSKIEKASTKEEGEIYYKMLTNPNPSIDQMSDYFAEQYIILIGKLLESNGFKQYEAEQFTMTGQNIPRNKLQQLMREASKKHKISDKKASDAMKAAGADVDAVTGNRDDSVYKQPKKISDATTASGSIDDLIGDADSFTEQGEVPQNDAALQNFSTVMFNIFSVVGAAVAVITGIIIGIKYMFGSIEEKANYKELLIPYIVGCTVIFSAFGIWKIVITVLESI